MPHSVQASVRPEQAPRTGKSKRRRRQEFPAGLTFRSLFPGLLRAGRDVLKLGGWRLLAVYAATQALPLLLVSPLLHWMFTQALASTGALAVNSAGIEAMLGNRVSLAWLAGLSVLALLTVSLQLAVLVVAAAQVRAGGSLRPAVLVRLVRPLLGRLLRPGSLALGAYLFLAVPLTQAGFFSVLTHSISIPNFVSGEMLKSTQGTLIYVSFLVVVGTIALRYSLAVPLFAVGGISGGKAMRLSWRMTGRTTPALLAGGAVAVLVCLLAGAGLVVLMLLPTLAADLILPRAAAVVAAFSLGAAQVAGVAIAGGFVLFVAGMLLELTERSIPLLDSAVQLRWSVNSAALGEVAGRDPGVGGDVRVAGGAGLAGSDAQAAGGGADGTLGGAALAEVAGRDPGVGGDVRVAGGAGLAEVDAQAAGAGADGSLGGSAGFGEVAGSDSGAGGDLRLGAGGGLAEVDAQAAGGGGDQGSRSSDAIAAEGPSLSGQVGYRAWVDPMPAVPSPDGAEDPAAAVTFRASAEGAAGHDGFRRARPWRTLPRRTGPRRRQPKAARAAAAAGAVVVPALFLGVLNLPVMEGLRNVPEALVLGHRGFSGGGVENTISGLRAASAVGADLVEMDVMQSSDGEFVVMHDASLQRLAGRNEAVGDLTLAELTSLTVHDQFGHTDSIPSLRDYILAAQEAGEPLLIEMKLHGGETEDYVERLIAELESLDALHENIYHSLSQEKAEELKRLQPELYVGLTLAVAGVASPATTADFIVVEEASYTAAVRESAWADGKDVYVWTVNGSGAIRNMLRDGVDGIITDHPDLALQDRDAMGPDEPMSSKLYDALMRFVVIF